jgi:ABC-type branched-subunit amino acid transport system permease subunit
MKLKTFIIGGVIAGLGGSVLVEYLTSWSPQAWSPIETFLLYAAVLVGGTASNNGVIVGAFFIYVFIQEITRFIPSLHLGATSLASVRDILIGLLIIGMLWFRPQGIWPEPRDKDVAQAVGPQPLPGPLESEPAAGS